MSALVAFTPEDKRTLIKSWALLKERSEEAAGTLFKKYVAQKLKHLIVIKFQLRFFEQNPELKQYFQETKAATWEEMNKDKSMKAHTMHVLYTLQMVIDTLEGDIELALEMVRKNVANHIRRRVRVEHFRAMKKVLLDTLAEMLGAEFTERVRKAWARGYDIVIDMVEGQAHEMYSM